ncbi:ER6L2 protein, partial [Nothocercus nigrocapillus]|nr:ER6L2 protein [Nothocercus nigrocapillus]
ISFFPVDRWQIGDKCLAPSLENGRLHEGIVKSIEKDKNGESFAVVSFLESEERKILVTKLHRDKSSKDPWKNLIFDDDDLEKPNFPHKNLLSPATAFKLSDNGDCIPYTINRYLRDYQREGAQFLYGHYVNGRGCILGDDMGLGKTIQVISFLAAVLNKKGTREDIENNMPEFLLRAVKKELKCGPKKTFLIVAPLSVLYNWKDELDTWGYFKVAILHGNKKDDDLSRIRQGKCEVALTTYEILRLYLDEFNSVEWSAVIVDEAHRIKNPKAQITQTMKALKCSVRIGLTGTILQNNMKELWCVMDWAVPGLLGTRMHFKKKFSDPVEHGQRHTATKRELATGRKAMLKLAGKMSGWFLRRTKALISDQLPKKEDRMVYCSLTEFQKAVYQAVLETEDVSLVLRAREPCSCSSGRKRKNCCYKANAHGETIKSLRFSYLTILQKVANHAALLQTDTASKHQEAHIKRVCNQVFSSFPDFVQLSKDAAFETISDPKYSGKMKVLQQLLNHFRKNKDKVLLFSFSTKLLDVLEQYCMASGLDYRRLDGNTKSEDRIRIVREFNGTQEINICLVSTMAGGLGLNFVGANVVILFDPTWNPANDLQAIDRAYRIGQCKDVKVFRLISLGTVEEMMYLRQVYKQQLHCVVVGSENAKRYFEAVQGSKEHQGELFGIHNLFKLRTQGSCLTKDILEREGRVEAGVMTATTWLKEETSPVSPEKVRYDRDPPNIKTQLKKEGFDFYDDFSDDDILEISREKNDRRKPYTANNSMIAQGQLSLMQCGFSKLLQREVDTTKESGNIDDAHYSSSQGEAAKTNVNNKSSDSHKKHNKRERKSDSQNIDEFSSSEDNLPVEKINVKKQSFKCKGKRVQFASEVPHHTKDISAAQIKPGNFSVPRSTAEVDNRDQRLGSMDIYLVLVIFSLNVSDGVQEVAYIHSNQNVVGSSKAENRLSRWAVRDVFELKQFSQLPAN